MNLEIPDFLLSAKNYISDEKILLAVLYSNKQKWWNLDELGELLGWKKGKTVSVFSKLDEGVEYIKSKHVSFDGKVHAINVYQYNGFRG